MVDTVPWVMLFFHHCLVSDDNTSKSGVILPALWACQWLAGVGWFEESRLCLSSSITKIHKERSLNLPCLWHPFTWLHCPFLFPRLSHCCLSPGCKVGYGQKLGARSRSYWDWRDLSGWQWGPEGGNWNPDHSERQTKSFCGEKWGLKSSLPTSPVSARFHSSSFPGDSYHFRQVTRQSQTKITSSAPAPAGSALTEAGSGWFSNQWKGVRTSPTYCWEGQGCACGSGQPGSITAVLQCRAKCGDTHGQVLLSGTPSVPRKPCGSPCLLTKSKCRCPAFLHQPEGWGDSQSMHIASCCLMAEMLFPPLGPEQSAHSHGRSADESCAALCSWQGLNA